MYPESQSVIDEMNLSLLETPSVFEAIFSPYAAKLDKIYFNVKSNDFIHPNWIIFIYYIPDFLCNFLMARFIHFSGLLNPGQSLPPAIGLAKNINTEKKKFLLRLDYS